MGRYGRTLLAVLVSVSGLCLFALLGASIKEQGRVTEFDAKVAESWHRSADPNDATRAIWGFISKTGYWKGVLVVAAGVSLVLFCRRHYGLALTVLGVVFSEWLLQTELKSYFQRPLPPYAAVPIDDAFPSGRTMASLIGYGLMAYVLVPVLPRRGQRWAVAAVALVWIALVAVSRLYLEEHWLSDVLAGLAIGIAYLAFWIAVIETVRQRLDRSRNQLPASQTVECNGIFPAEGASRRWAANPAIRSITTES
jgi:undecaprenyl-diphosphatase